MIGSSPLRLSRFPNRPQTCLTLQTFRRTAGQSSSAQCSILPKYLKYSTPSNNSAPYSPVRLKVTPIHFAVISASLLLHLICVFLSHRAVRQCLMSRTAGMCILHKLQRGSGSFPSCTTTICEQKCLNVKYSPSLPALCATAGHPSTGRLID